MTMAEREPILEARSLSFVYPESQYYALHDVNIKIFQGEYIGITGASGAGKTTLCLALCGVIPNLIQGGLVGDVFVNGRNTREAAIADLVRDIGVVMQDPESQLFSLSVFADVTFGLENLKFSREEIVKRADWALEVVGMSDFKKRPSGSLSGGQKQRVALACALALGSKIIVLDEPTSELDPIGSEEVFMTLQSLRDQGLTIVLVEQKVEEITRFVDRLIYVKDGCITLDAPPRKFFEQMRETYLANGSDIYMPDATALAFELSQHHQADFDLLPLDEVEFIEQFKKYRRTV
jgi:energy-coupling factor transport system ATP-binding protein